MTTRAPAVLKIWGWGFNPKNLAAEPKYSCYCWYIQYIDQIVWSVYKQTLLPSYMTWWQTKSQGFELFHRVWPFRLLQQFWSESHQACWRCSVAPGRRKIENIAKGTTDPRVEFILPKKLLEAMSQVQTQIFIKFIFRISTKNQLKISTKLQHLHLT